MDGSHFDSLMRTLATTRLTRVQTLRGLAAGGVAALTGITRRSEEAGTQEEAARERDEGLLVAGYVDGRLCLPGQSDNRHRGGPLRHRPSRLDGRLTR